jgi:hypothetical protein
MHLDKISTNASFAENVIKGECDVAAWYGYLHLQIPPCESLTDTGMKIPPHQKLIDT